MQRGLDWRWRSYGAVAARVELLRRVLAAALAERDRPAAEPAPRIGFEDTGRPSAMALDLAIQAAGSCAAPLPAGLAGYALDAALAERGCALLARFEPRAGEPAPPAAAVPAVSLPRREPSESEAPPPGAAWAAGSVLLPGGAAGLGAGSAVPGGPAGPFEEVALTLVAAAADRFAARLAEARCPPRARRAARREILVLPRPLHHPGGRLLAAWALAAGAALVLEPEPKHLTATALWVRPTVFAGDPGEVAALRAALGERRRRGLPLRRLHTVAVLAGAASDAALPDAERRFWADRGTVVTVV